MPRWISVILLSLALICGLGGRAAWALPAQPLTLHGNLTVDSTQLKQDNTYFTRYVVFITVEGQTGTIFSYTMGDNPSDEYWLIMPMSAGDREQGTIQTGDTAHIFVDIDDNPDNGNEAEAKESPYTIGMPGDDVSLNISCSIEPGQPTDLTALLGVNDNDEPDFGRIVLSWTASGNDGDMRTVDGYEGIISSKDPGGLTEQDLENWWTNGSAFDTSGWISLSGPGEKENRVAILNQPVDYAAAYDGIKYYVGLRAIQSPGSMVYAAINMPPEAFDLSIAPAIPGAADALTRRYSYRDPEGDSESGNRTRIRWYQNGFIQPAHNDEATVSSSAIAAGDTWYFTIQPDDGNSLGLIATSHSVTIRNADLEVSNGIDNNSPDEGDTITYAVTVVNNGPDNATNIVITDLLPPGVTYVSDDANGHYDSSTGLWIVGDLNSGNNAILTVIATINLGACADNLSSTASVIAVDQADPDVSNNSDSAEITMQCADMAVVNSVDNDSPNEGDTITYTITVTNNGNNDASNVEITDLLPPGITYVSDNADDRYDSNTGIWTVGDLNNGDSVTLAITATVDTGIINEDTCGVPMSNTATVTALDQNDPDSENNSDSIDVSVPCADLEVSHSVDDPAPNDGDTITYIITVTNNGADTATNVEIIDLLPPEITYSTAILTQGRLSYAPADAQVTWTVGDLPNGANATLTVKATVNIGIVDENICGVPIISTASVTALDQKDPNGENNSNSVEIMAPCADLAVSSKVNNPSPDAGEAATYTVTVINNGPGNATNVAITDQLPSEVTYISNSSSQGSYNYNNGRGEWTVGELNSGASATLAITVRIDEALEDTVVTYTASVTAADQVDSNVDNNSSSVFLTGSSGKSDLAVNVGVDNEAPNEGDTITYTITVTNNGPGEATGAVVTDLMPSKLIYVSNLPSQGSYDIDKGEWPIGDLANEASATLVITAIVDTNACADTITNIIILTAMDQVDPYVSNNNDSVDITVQCADLAIGNIVDNSFPNEGDTVAYTITVTNNGNGNATNVEITDLLPSGVTYVSDSPSQGSYDSGQGVWTVGDLNTGAHATLIITARVDAGTGGATIKNSASITGMDQVDPDGSNNMFSASLTSVKLDLISASYEAMKSQLTLVFNDAVDPERTRFDRIGIEIDDRLSQDFNLSDDQDECPTIMLEAPYEDNGMMLYPVTMNIQCEVSSALSLAISAFVTSPAGAIELVLKPGAFTDTDSGQSPAAYVPLSIAANGLDLRTKGDVSGDGEITAHDARLILQYIVHGGSWLPIYDTVAELESWLNVFWQNEEGVDIIGYLANTDGQPRITANDAAMVLRFSAGLMDSFCESCAPIASMTRRNGRLTASKYQDGKLEISVNLDDASDVYSADIVIAYDPQALTLTDVSTSEWLSEHAIAVPGKLRISLAGIYQPEDGSLVNLSFHAISADAIKKLSLTELKLNGGELRTSIQNLPRSFALLQNYPNPFNPETWISYRLSEPANVNVTIYNMTGQVVRRLELGNRMPGSYVDKSEAAYWDGRNEAGEGVSSGIYFYRLQADQNASVKKMTIAE